MLHLCSIEASGTHPKLDVVVAAAAAAVLLKYCCCCKTLARMMSCGNLRGALFNAWRGVC